MPENTIALLRKNRNSSSSVTRGKLPDVSISSNAIFGFTLFSFFIFVFSGFIFGGLFSIFFGNSGILLGILFAIFLVLLFLFWPIAVILCKKYETGEKPKDEILKTFNSAYDWLKKHIYKYNLVEITNYTIDEEEKKKPIVAMKRNRDSSDFSLWLGKSTGHLATLWHPAGMAENQEILLNLEDACQNILVLGGIGSGKTTCVMQPLLLQCLDQQCGGLIFDIKGDVKTAVNKFAAATQKKLVVLHPMPGFLLKSHIRTCLL
jgi:hypothetical protein